MTYRCFIFLKGGTNKLPYVIVNMSIMLNIPIKIHALMNLKSETSNDNMVHQYFLKT